MSIVSRVLLRFGYVRLADYGYSLAPDGRIVELPRVTDDRFAPPPWQPMPWQDAPQAHLAAPPAIPDPPPPVPSPDMLSAPAQNAHTPETPAPSTPVRTEAEEEEWEWRMALARARERAARGTEETPAHRPARPENLTRTAAMPTIAPPRRSAPVRAQTQPGTVPPPTPHRSSSLPAVFRPRIAPEARVGLILESVRRPEPRGSVMPPPHPSNGNGFADGSSQHGVAPEPADPTAITRPAPPPEDDVTTVHATIDHPAAVQLGSAPAAAPPHSNGNGSKGGADGADAVTAVVAIHPPAHDTVTRESPLPRLTARLRRPTSIP